GNSSKLWVIPTEFTAALQSITSAFIPGGGPGSGGSGVGGTGTGGGSDESGGGEYSRSEEGFAVDLPETSLQDPAEALRQARGEVSEASAEANQAGESSGRPFDDSAAAGQRPADDEGQTENCAASGCLPPRHSHRAASHTT